MTRSGRENVETLGMVSIGAVTLLLAVFLLAPVASAQDPCVVTDNGSGTVTLPPAGCDYLSPTEVHVIIDGLPPNTTIELAPIHKDFICYEVLTCTILVGPGDCEAAGGSLGGNGDCFVSTLEFELTGTGDLAGFSRTLSIPADVEIHTGPRNPGDPVQTFPTEMVSLQGSLSGDPDFQSLQITAGSAFGLSSPGSTTLTDLGDGTFNVDSFFDITYEISFVGAVGGALAGYSGTTTGGTLTMGAGVSAGPSVPGLEMPMWLLLLGGLLLTGAAMLVRRQGVTAR